MRRLIIIDKAEQWRVVPGFNGYMVSDYGRFKRTTLSGDFELMGKIDRVGYRQIGLIRGGRQQWFLAHRIIAAVFLPASELSSPDGEFMTVNHKDRDKLNNRLDNLELVSVADNHRHWRKHDLLKLSSAQ